MLRFDDIAFGYMQAGVESPVLRDVTFRVEPGQEVAVVGPNGSGKSTLARLSNGILLPRSGCVSVDGIETTDASRIRELREKVGIVFQHPDDQIVATSVEDDVAFGPENLGLDRASIRERVDRSLAAVGLTGFEAREPHLLSGGQKQRLAIAGALAMKPAYLVLDEPTSMLDPEGRSEVLRIISELRAAGHGVIHITHDLADIAAADLVLVLDAGCVVYLGSVEELFKRPALLRQCGLELPPGETLVAELRRLGAPVPEGAWAPEDLAEALWP